MNETLKLISSFNRDDYFENVNLHIHSTCSDGVLEPKEIIEKAKSKGLKYFSITDHNTLNAYDEIEPVEGLITGVEFDCWQKTTLLHILGYGVDTKNEELKALCAKDKAGTTSDLVRFFSRRKPTDVIKAIKNAGGVAFLAHPACCWDINLKKMVKELAKMGLDGLELYYPYKRHRGIIKFYTKKQVANIAKELNLPVTGGTDAHGQEI